MIDKFLNPTWEEINSLIGQVISRVSLEPTSIEVLFDDTLLHITGHWKLRSSDGKTIDQDIPLEVRQQFDLWRLCGKRVTDVDLVDDTEAKLVIHIPSIGLLEALADEDGFEDWTLSSPRFFYVCNGRDWLFEKA